MLKPVALFISLRYIAAKKRNGFISCIALVSMLGIAIGVMTLITVMSVMNGFEREITTRVFSMVPPLTITTSNGILPNWPAVATMMQQEPAMLGLAPFVRGEALLTVGDAVAPIIVTGITPLAKPNPIAVLQHLTMGSLKALQPDSFNIIIGLTLAKRLQLTLGAKVVLLLPAMTVTPVGINPRFKRFTVAGIFNAGNGFGFDDSLAFISLADGQKLYGLGDAVTGLHASLADAWQAPKLTQSLNSKFPAYAISDWTKQFGAYFHAVQLEKTMMFVILILIIIVAAFNLVTTLVMLVNEKASAIAILRTLGATPGMIMSIFILQGAIIGVCGAVLGLGAGLFLTWHVSALVSWLQTTFNVELLSSNVYFVNYLPVALLWTDVGKIMGIAVLLSLLATIYPAWRAANLSPVESLRYE
jgi:lipoprotein-releasing system permease protein